MSPPFATLHAGRHGKHRGRRFPPVWLRVGALAGCVAGAVGSMDAVAARADSPVRDLIARLGADEFHDRESAAARLRAIGPAAIDDLLAAAETSDDLEVSLRARWLVDTIPLDQPHDPPAVIKLLASYKKGSYGERVRAMQRLLQLEDEAGIEALARIVRLDRSTRCSRVAGALLAREWYADDPAFARIGPRISAGLGASQRPTAVLLRALVAAAGPDPAGRQTAVADAEAAHGAVSRAAAPGGRRFVAPPDDRDRSSDVEAGTIDETQRIFDRTRIRLLLAAGRRDDARAAAEPLMLEPLSAGITPAAAATAADTLAWCVQQGLPELGDALARASAPWVREQPLVGLAIAHAERARGLAESADARADAALASAVNTGDDRLTVAMRLARWGCADWATRAYDSLLDDPGLSPPERMLSAILSSEFLHDQGRDDDAARRLGEALQKRDDRTDIDDILRALDRDQRSVLSRKLYFESCAAEARGDTAERRKLVEASLAANGKDVDALIALYKLTDNTPAQVATAAERVEEALRQIDNEIQATPDEANGYNEYAWLVANTAGDLEKATRYSRISLDKSFDNSSYLDTLAHCRAAAGDYDAAVRWQSRAWRQEPGSRTIKRNLDRFRRLAAARAER